MKQTKRVLECRFKKIRPINESIESDLYDRYAEDWDIDGTGDIAWDKMYNNDLDTYIDALEYTRRISMYGDQIPDVVWDLLIEYVEEGATFRDPYPLTVVDNVAINGEYGDFDDYKEEGETDEDFISRYEDDCVAIFPEDRFIVISL